MAFWHPAAEAALRAAWASAPAAKTKNAFWRDVAARLPGRTTSAVQTRAGVLGLAPKLEGQSAAPPARDRVWYAGKGQSHPYLDGREVQVGATVELLVLGQRWLPVRIDGVEGGVRLLLDLSGARARVSGPGLCFDLPPHARVRWPAPVQLQGLQLALPLDAR